MTTLMVCLVALGRLVGIGRVGRRASSPEIAGLRLGLAANGMGAGLKTGRDTSYEGLCDVVEDAEVVEAISSCATHYALSPSRQHELKCIAHEAAADVVGLLEAGEVLYFLEVLRWFLEGDGREEYFPVGVRNPEDAPLI